MITVTYAGVINNLYTKLLNLHDKESKGEGSKDIQISSIRNRDIVFKNTKNMIQIMIECGENIVKIYITDYYNQKLLFDYQENDEIRIKKWFELFNRYRKLLSENEELKNLEKVENIVEDFFI